MTTVKLECGCIIENAEAYTVQWVSAGVKIMCPTCRFSFRVIKVLND